MWSTVRRRGAHVVASPRPSSRTSARPRDLTLDDMPAPRGLPLVGTALSLLWAGSAPKLHLYVDKRHKELGPIFRDRIGPVDAVFVADPAEMRRTFALEGKYPIHILPEPWILYNTLYGCKRGLFFMDGENWLKMRRAMNPLMLKPEQTNIFFNPCQHVADSLVNKWKSHKITSLQNLELQLYKWSLDTIIAVMMGSCYNVHAEKWDKTVEDLAVNVHKIFLETGRMSLISAKFARACHLPVWKRFVNSVDASLAAARFLVLQMTFSSSTSSDGLLAGMLNAGLSKDEIEKVVVDLIIAAGDTTALSLQWALYLLAKNSHVQEKVAYEVCKEGDVMQSSLLRGVIREALRLYPVAPFLTRIMPESCVIGGYKLPPMGLVLLSLYTSGRDAQNFPEPEKFWPERWQRESLSTTGSYKAVINPHASMPFALGARSCIGRKLAETQMITTLASILREFHLELSNTENVDMILHLVAVPSSPIQICLSPRRKE